MASKLTPFCVPQDYRNLSGHLSRNSLHLVVEPEQPLDFSTKKVHSSSKLTSLLEGRNQGFSCSRSPIPLEPLSNGLKTSITLSTISSSNGVRELGGILLTDQSASVNSLSSPEVYMTPGLGVSPNVGSINNRLLNAIPGSAMESPEERNYNWPFKAYPKTAPSTTTQGYYNYPIQFPLTFDSMTTQNIFCSTSDQAYLQFREKMLSAKKRSQEYRRSASRQEKQKRYVDTADTNSCSAANILSFVDRNRETSTPDVSESDSLAFSSVNTYISTTAVLIHPSSNAVSTLIETPNQSVPENDETDTKNIMKNEINTRASGENSPSTPSQVPTDLDNGKRSGSLSDEAYWEKRRKNNEAAKRSRDARRAKEDEIAIRAAFLEQENLRLRVEVAALKSETVKLRCLLSNS
ncbi:uncharacterized protein LOC106466940 [Limulus polyphemus]|uniref:Uncharacterized protein LOC106466940 n=1 Tax=Limulus polyphemus TaxID=6850 RepID=A0ABM1BIK0_LIMPO|nr:uncharacterized protein LOC106466940 [Limulus polyphemus]